MMMVMVMLYIVNRNSLWNGISGGGGGGGCG